MNSNFSPGQYPIYISNDISNDKRVSDVDDDPYAYTLVLAGLVRAGRALASVYADVHNVMVF